MALVKQNLEDDLVEYLAPFPETKLLAAQLMAKAYHDYCQTALFGSSVPEIPSANESAMATTLDTNMVGTIVDFIAGWDSALAVYWAAVPVAGGSGAGVTEPPTLTMAAGPMPADMLARVSGVKPSVEEFCADLATSLDLITKTVIADLTLPPAGPVPTPIS
jgi:hypothetical protein